MTALRLQGHRLAWLALSALPVTAHGHAFTGPDAGAPILGWRIEPLVMLSMTASLVLYLIGFARLRHRSRRGRARSGMQCASFLAGWLVLAIAFVSPLDGLGAWLFSAHMVQHELLMIVAAPLLVIGRPLGVWLWAFPSGGRLRVGRATRPPRVRATWHALTTPAGAWALHALALWVWHVPAAFEAALQHPALHALQHASFLASALLFWWSILGRGPAHAYDGPAMLSLFTTMVHTGALGALLTLAPAPWYPAYLAPTSSLGFDPLEDQQLGGLVMWVPGGLAYLIAALATTARWLAARDDSPPALPSPHA